MYLLKFPELQLNVVSSDSPPLPSPPLSSPLPFQTIPTRARIRWAIHLQTSLAIPTTRIRSATTATTHSRRRAGIAPITVVGVATGNTNSNWGRLCSLYSLGWPTPPKSPWAGPAARDWYPLMNWETLVSILAPIPLCAAAFTVWILWPHVGAAIVRVMPEVLLCVASNCEGVEARLCRCMTLSGYLWRALVGSGMWAFSAPQML